MLKKTKRSVALALAGVLAFTCVTGPEAFAAKKIKLSKKSVKLEVGKTAKVKLKNGTKKGKVVIKNSNKKAVKVTKKLKGCKGYLKLKGKAVGTAKIKVTCKVNGKKTKLSMKVQVKEASKDTAADVSADVSAAASAAASAVAAASDQPSAAASAAASADVQASTAPLATEEAPAITETPATESAEVTETPATETPETETEEATEAPAEETEEATLAPTPEPLPDGYEVETQNFTPVEKLPIITEIPDIMKFMDGSEVTVEKWNYRAAEIRKMYEYYMYGVWRDGTGEEVSYNVENKEIDITIKTDGSAKGQEEGEVEFTATIQTPSGEAPEKGWPYLVNLGGITNVQTVLNNGFAVVNFSLTEISADKNSHTGIFYDLYPYNEDDWEEQSGVLEAWAWGASKIVDAIDQGAGESNHLNKDFPMVTGVSRYGKAAAVAGTFETRFKICMPTCSGAGGMGSFFYNPGGKKSQTYDVSSLGFEDTYTYDKNNACEKLSNLHNGEDYWFCENFAELEEDVLFFDQYMLSALFAQEGRSLMLVGAFNWDGWQNTPGLWYNFQMAKPVFDMLGYSNNIAIHLHDTSMGHAVVDSDVVALSNFYRENYLGEDVPDFEISDLQTTLFDLEETPSGINNKAVYEKDIPKAEDLDF